MPPLLFYPFNLFIGAVFSIQSNQEGIIVTFINLNDILRPQGKHQKTMNLPKPVVYSFFQ